MSNQDDRWLWFIDDAPLQALLKAEGSLGTMRMRAASSPGLVRAMTLHMEGRTADAAVELRKSIDSGERQPESFLFLGQIHFEARQYEEAAAVYQQLVQLEPENAIAAFNAGVCTEKLSRWNDAAEMFRRAVNLDPERKESSLGLGLCCLHQRRADEALSAFDRYLDTEPESEPAQFGRAVALQMLRRFDEASLIYERFLAAGDPSPELLTNLLALAVARKDQAALLRISDKLARVRPGTRQAAEAQAYAAIVAGDWEPAATHLAQFAESDPLPEDWAYVRAYALWRTGRGEEAAQHLSALLATRPNHAAALLLRGVLLEETGELDEALTAYRKAATQAPDSDSASWNVARVAAVSGKADVCRMASKSLLDRNRNSPEGWFSSGLAALLENRPAEAVRGFNEALRLRREWPEAEWNLGCALLDTGDAAKALKYLEKAHSVLGNHVSPEPLTRAALGIGNLDRALHFVDSVSPKSGVIAPETVYNLAVALHESGKFEVAERLYRRVIDEGPAFADAHINLGHLLLAAGRPQDAESIWSDAAAIEAAA